MRVLSYQLILLRRISGLEEIRTLDLIIANDALYQLSYEPNFTHKQTSYPLKKTYLVNLTVRKP